MPVYLDHAATTPMLPDAREAYIDALGVVGNPASIHSQGQQARRMLEEARENVAASVSADPVEVVLTSACILCILILGTNMCVLKMFYYKTKRC